jgi:hypothetical protein
MTRKVSVDLGELQIALSTSSQQMEHYLDLETGRVILISEDIQFTLREIRSEMNDGESGETRSLEEVLADRDHTDWKQEMLLDADRIERGYGTRYLLVEQLDPHADYGDMERFISTVEDQRMRERLEIAIHGRGAFRRFKDLIARYPDTQDQWYAYKDARERQQVLEWLGVQGIEPVP